MFYASSLTARGMVGLVTVLESSQLFFRFVFRICQRGGVLNVPVVRSTSMGVFFGGGRVRDRSVTS